MVMAPTDGGTFFGFSDPDGTQGRAGDQGPRRQPANPARSHRPWRVGGPMTPNATSISPHSATGSRRFGGKASRDEGFAPEWSASAVEWGEMLVDAARLAAPTTTSHSLHGARFGTLPVLTPVLRRPQASPRGGRLGRDQRNTSSHTRRPRASKYPRVSRSATRCGSPLRDIHRAGWMTRPPANCTATARPA
jgi:hypothetical protein